MRILCIKDGSLFFSNSQKRKEFIDTLEDCSLNEDIPSEDIAYDVIHSETLTREKISKREKPSKRRRYENEIDALPFSSLATTQYNHSNNHRYLQCDTENIQNLNNIKFFSNITSMNNLNNLNEENNLYRLHDINRIQQCKVKNLSNKRTNESIHHAGSSTSMRRSIQNSMISNCKSNNYNFQRDSYCDYMDNTSVTRNTFHSSNLNQQVKYHPENCLQINNPTTTGRSCDAKLPQLNIFENDPFHISKNSLFLRSIDCNIVPYEDYVMNDDDLDENTMSDVENYNSGETIFNYSEIISAFRQYSDAEDPSIISGENWKKFKHDLRISNHDLKYYLFVYFLNCSSREYIQEVEWVRGMYALKCDSMELLHRRLNVLSNQAFFKWRPDEMKTLLTFVFSYLKDSKQSRTICGIAGATALCNIIQNCFSKPFLDFITNSKYKCLNLDQFKIFVDFSWTFGNDLNVTGYDPNDAFPTLYDDFVEFLRENQHVYYNHNQHIICRNAVDYSIE